MMWSHATAVNSLVPDSVDIAGSMVDDSDEELVVELQQLAKVNSPRTAPRSAFGRVHGRGTTGRRPSNPMSRQLSLAPPQGEGARPKRGRDVYDSFIDPHSPARSPQTKGRRTARADYVDFRAAAASPRTHSSLQASARMLVCPSPACGPSPPQSPHTGRGFVAVGGGGSSTPTPAVFVSEHPFSVAGQSPNRDASHGVLVGTDRLRRRKFVLPSHAGTSLLHKPPTATASTTAGRRAHNSATAARRATGHHYNVVGVTPPAPPGDAPVLLPATAPITPRSAAPAAYVGSHANTSRCPPPVAAPHLPAASASWSAPPAAASAQQFMWGGATGDDTPFGTPPSSRQRRASSAASVESLFGLSPLRQHLMEVDLSN